MHTKIKLFSYITTIFLLVSCQNYKYPYKEMQVICVPVYGQSYALGEEAIRVTDFDSLRIHYNHRILTENLDEEFGYFSDTELKQFIKKIIRNDQRSFELQCYGMAEHFLYLSKNDSLLFCTFPGGQGTTSIAGMMPGSKAYSKFIKEIESACQKAQAKGWTFKVSAYCWMQGENDVVWHTSTNYKKDLQSFHRQLSKDIQNITQQKEAPICICYQTNCLTMLNSETSALTYDRPEIYVPKAQLELITQQKEFMASGPVYPYSCVDERIHIDGIGQKRLGYLAGLTLYRYLSNKENDGLYPTDIQALGNKINILFHIPHPPLTWDTLQVSNPGHYGFTVITPEGKNILTHASIQGDTVCLSCSEPIKPTYKVRYAINGTPYKNGNRRGARGNLRDSQGDYYTCKIKNEIYRLDNWCFQFEEMASKVVNE
jgi:hypothetical protein